MQGSEASSSAGERVWARLAWALFGAYALYYLYLAFGLPMDRVVNGLLDDSFYYLQVARNVAQGHGSTFDGVEPTNGYHPLWMLCLVPIYWVTGADSDLAVRLALLFAAVLSLGSLLLLRSLLRRVASEWAVCLAYLLWSWPRFFGLSQNLLESSLLLLLLLAFARLAVARAVRGRTPLLGLILGLAALARLDTVFLFFAIALAALLLAFRGKALFQWQEGRRPLGDALWPSVLLLAVATIVVAPYLGWNLARFGHLAPISGAMKSSFPQVRPTWSTLSAFPEFTLLLGLALGFVALLPRSDSPLLRILGVIGLAAALHFTYTVLFMVWGVDRWHFSLLIPIALLALPWGAERMAARFLPSAPARALPLFAGLWLAVAVQTTALKLRDGRWLSKTRELALSARESLPPDAVVAMTDSGIFAYWSERTTINLDGLINNYRYRDLLRSGHFADYLAERHVSYILDQNHVGSRDYLTGRYQVRPFRIWYRPEGRVAGEVKLFREDEVRRVPVASRVKLGSIRTEPNVLLLWRYRPERQNASNEAAHS